MVLTFGYRHRRRAKNDFQMPRDPDLPGNAYLVRPLTPSEGNDPWTIMSCEITLWIEEPLLRSARFLLLTWWNWADDTEDEDNFRNLNYDTWVEGYGAGGSRRFEHRHNHDGYNGECYGAHLFQERERENGREWLTSRRVRSASFWLVSVKYFNSPSPLYQATRN